MQDVQRLCDESKVRNRDLEKIQLRFDAEMTQSKSKYEKEKELREKCERERESSKYEIFSLKNELETQKLEINYHVEKCERLERDIKEYESVSVNGNSSASSIQSNTQFMKMKSQIRDMESKIKDQEEELDDQQGTIQQLEQAKLKLEMQFEKEKQKFQRELAEKDSEMDDLRFHTQKKIKAIEMQLEEESDLTNNLQREKREIERKLRELTANNSGKKGFMLNGISNNGHGNDIYEYINKLKRNMAKYKTLAIDAQTQLEKLRENLPKQSIIKSLKLQLEDSEFIKSNALKSKEILQAEIINLQQQLDDLNFFKQNVSFTKKLFKNFGFFSYIFHILK
jgi:myosin-18